MILLMGMAGSGKGTQGELLVARDGYGYLSTGAMLRSFATPEQKARMATGQLLGDQEIIEMVDKTLDTLEDPNHVILDGFPRTVSQAEWLIGKSQNAAFKLDTVINLVVEQSVVLERLLSRGRPDDTEEALQIRFKEHERLLPVLEYLRGQGATIIDINANQSPEEVHAEVIQALGNANAG